MLLSASSSSAAVLVEKATSDLLINPDWTMNINICDYVNTNPGQARDVLKAVKKRLQHKSPTVQFLALTLLEAMVNNCGDYIHFQIVEKNVLEEMVKIVKKKTDMNARDKTLSLLDTWQEAFGGQGGKYPQYYYAYDELRRSGVEFPRRSSPVAPIFTPPVAHPAASRDHEGYGMPSSSRRLDEAMAAEKNILSASTLESMNNITELLKDMLQAMSPGDVEAVKDEIVIDLVDRCRANQKKLSQMLTTTEDEKLLAQGLELHDLTQNLLAKHDAVASGSALSSQASVVASAPITSSPPATENRSQPGEANKDIFQGAGVSPQSPAAPDMSSKGFIDEEEEEDDDFTQLARRHSISPTSRTTFNGNSTNPVPAETTGQIRTSSQEAKITAASKAVVLADPPLPITTTKEQDIIDLLSLSLTTTLETPQDPPATPPSFQNIQNSPNVHANPYISSQPNFNKPHFIAPWAQPQQQEHTQPLYPQMSYGYPPPPWASSSLTSDDQHSQPVSNGPFGFSTGAEVVSHASVEGSGPRPSFSPPIVNNRTSSIMGPASAPSATGQKSYVLPHRLFEDLNVLSNGNMGHKAESRTSSPSLSGMTGQSWFGGGR